MRRATYSAERMKFDERRRHFGVSSSYDYKDWTYKNNQHNYSNYNHHYLDAMIDKPDDPILVDFTHYYYKEENPTFGLKCISLIKRQSNKDNKIYYVMVYSFLNFDVASMFLEELYQKKTFF